MQDLKTHPRKILVKLEQTTRFALWCMNTLETMTKENTDFDNKFFIFKLADQ